MNLQFFARIAETSEHFALPGDADTLARVIRADSQHGTGTPLALTATARAYYERLPLSLNPEHFAATVSDSFHVN